MRMRWRTDGGDHLCGWQTFQKRSLRPRGPGGLVSWHVNPVRWQARAWTKEKEKNFPHSFNSPETAKAAVERWLDLHTPLKRVRVKVKKRRARSNRRRV